jgi:hypothetical protein
MQIRNSSRDCDGYSALLIIHSSKTASIALTEFLTVVKPLFEVSLCMRLIDKVSLGPFTETKHNFMEIFIATDTVSVQLFFNYSPPELRLASEYLSRRSLPPGIGTTV